MPPTSSAKGRTCEREGESGARRPERVRGEGSSCQKVGNGGLGASRHRRAGKEQPGYFQSWLKRINCAAAAVMCNPQDVKKQAHAISDDS
eukprot:1956117-Pleurochrysis_carterae.AAC.1